MVAAACDAPPGCRDLNPYAYCIESSDAGLQFGSLILFDCKQVVISLIGVIVETPPPVLYKLPQLLIHVPACGSPR